MDDFYVTLPSSTPYPGNTITDFRVQLESPINFKGNNYMVALTEIHFKNDYHYLHYENDRKFFIGYQSKGEIRVSYLRTIPKYYYYNIGELLDIINHSIEEKNNELNLQSSISLEYNKRENRIHINPAENKKQFLYFERKLGEILGFQPKQWYNDGDNNVREVNFIPNSSQFYVTSNIVEPEVVSNTKMNLLRRVIVTDETIGSYVTKVYDRPYYKTIVTPEINTIHIQIYDQQGDSPPFECAEIIIVLHFKRS